MRSLLTVSTVFSLSLSLFSPLQSAEVTLKGNPQSVKASIGEDVFLVFQFDQNRKKPFALPVTGPGGFELLSKAEASDAPGVAGRQVVLADESPRLKPANAPTDGWGIGTLLTVGKIDGDWLEIPAKQLWIHKGDVVPAVSNVVRLIDDNPSKTRDRLDPTYYDHPHHKGIWLSVDEIEKVRFWNEDGPITTKSVELVTPVGNPAELRIVNHWIHPDGRVLLHETTLISIYANRLLTYDVTFTTPQASIEIGDTKEGMFGIRLPNSMREYVGNGPITNAEGLSGTKAAWGRTSRWVDYRGPVDGHTFGVTMMDHPGNPIPSRYHVRDYGLFSINPFGAGSYTKGRDDEQPEHHRTFKKGESLNFKYGLFIHAGETPVDTIEQAYQQFVGANE